MKVIKQILKEVKKANTIVIARHIGPDPDCIGAQNAFKELLKVMYPKKNIYAVGMGTKRLDYLGVMDRVLEQDIEHDLLIVLDTPNISRVDMVNVDLYNQVIKIDHHPFTEDFNGVEWVDTTATSTCELLLKMILEQKLPLNYQIAMNLYVGIMSDTNRFLFLDQQYRSMRLLSKMLEMHPLPLPEIHRHMYDRPLMDVKYQGYLINILEKSKHGVGFIYVTDDILKEYKMDVGINGNLIASFLNIKELPVIAFFTEDVKNKNIRVNIRSSKIEIHRVAEAFGGGGHPLASGVRLTEEKDINKLVDALDKLLKDHKE